MFENNDITNILYINKKKQIFDLKRKSLNVIYHKMIVLLILVC